MVGYTPQDLKAHGGDRRTRQQAERCRTLRQQAIAERRSGRNHFGTDLLTVIAQEVGEPDPLEVAPAPAPLVGEIRPLAGQRAHRPRGFTGRAIGEIEQFRVSQVDVSVRVPGRVAVGDEVAGGEP